MSDLSAEVKADLTHADLTFAPESRYGSNLWASFRLGLTKDSFFRKREELYQYGFPYPHPVTNKYLKEDVDDWISANSCTRGDIILSTEKKST